MLGWVALGRNLTPRLLIKDDEAPNPDGTYKTRLLILATNFFAQCFAKNAYKAIKLFFDANNVNYAEWIIVQSSHFKGQLEELNLKANVVMMASLDMIVFKLILANI